MIDFTLTTPALLFPAISLLLLAYTNRFLAIATLVRHLHNEYKTDPDRRLMGQIRNLRLRLQLIRFMQAFGVLGLFLCVFCMFLLFNQMIFFAKISFGLGLLLLMTSLGLSVWEIHISIQALNIQLSDLEDKN